MKTFTAARAKTNFGEFLDASLREPVIVTKNNRPISILISIEDLEDTIWGQKILDSHEKGYLSAADSDAVMNKYLNAKA
jgi:prevent-host-death family protein